MTGRIDRLYTTFSYLRTDSFNKGRACEKIIDLLSNNGYQVMISDGCEHNIETYNEDPEFIVITHYNSTFKFDADSSTSGLIGSLILSQELNDYRKKIKFVFLGNEKNELEFLKNFHKDCKIINLDSIGRGKEILILTNGERSNEFKEDFLNHLNKKRVKCMVKNILDDTYIENFKTIFVKRADYINGEIIMPWINSEEDTLEKIQYNKIIEVINLIKSYITNKMW